MRRGLVIALAVALALVLIGLLFMGAAWLRGVRSIDLSNLNIGFGGVNSVFGYEDFDSDWSSDGTYSVSAADVRSLEVLWVAGSVRVLPADTDTISFTETCREPLTERNALRWRVKDGKLTIQFCKSGRYQFDGLTEKELEVILPRSLAGNLSELELSNVSGGIEAEGLTAGKAVCSTVSGAQVLRDCSARGLDVNSVSGSITLTACTAERLEVNSVSGRHDLEGDFGELKADTTSGQIHAELGGEGCRVKANTVSGAVLLHGRIAEADVDTTSGAVTVETAGKPGKLDINTTSGDVRLILPDDCGFTLDYDSASGELTSGLAMVSERSRHIRGDGSCEIKVDTTSGDLTVETK